MTYSDLYSDFLTSIRLYSEALPVTEEQFMRWLTTGMSKMQRDARLISFDTLINRNSDGGYPIPRDVLDFVAVLVDGFTLRMSDWSQMQRIGELDSRNRPTQMLDPTRFREYPEKALSGEGTAKLWCPHAGMIRIHPDDQTITQIRLVYEPNIEPTTPNSTQWTEFYTGDFNQAMADAYVPRSFMPYVSGLVSYATAEFLFQQRQKDAFVYESEFLKEVESAKANKPNTYRADTRIYRMAVAS